MKVLGYPRLISLSNFRVPNFALVAEILIWLVQRFEPDADLPMDHENEQDRVALIRRVAEFMVKLLIINQLLTIIIPRNCYMHMYMLQAIKTNVKLNTRKLYQADGCAVREMSKMASLLYEAQTTSNEENSLGADNGQPRNLDVSEKLSELKTTRQLASQLTVNGATLFDLLGREIELRDIRNSKVARQYDTAEIEVALKEVIEATRREIQDTKKQIDNVKVHFYPFTFFFFQQPVCKISNDLQISEKCHCSTSQLFCFVLFFFLKKDNEQSLETRIERRRTELDRNQKRLQTLKKVRPAFMEEFEKLEVELRGVYDDYLQKCRYLAYLEHLYEDAAKAEQERFERR